MLTKSWEMGLAMIPRCVAVVLVVFDDDGDDDGDGVVVSFGCTPSKVEQNSKKRKKNRRYRRLINYSQPVNQF